MLNNNSSCKNSTNILDYQIFVELFVTLPVIETGSSEPKSDVIAVIPQGNVLKIHH
jgi:hypothetical protein